ncbi:MAG: N-acetylmuramoyl-L-alanine amidase [Bacilli bacterium]|nr:N-acetylmuramoyl-L-alanine amidase [Bacilli bacterium]
MDNPIKKKIVILLIIIFSGIFLYNVYKIASEIYKTKKAIDDDYEYNDVTDILNYLDDDSLENIIDKVDTENAVNYSIVYNAFTSNGINIAIYLKDANNPEITLKGSKYSISYTLTKLEDKIYAANISLAALNNDTYIFYLSDNGEENNILNTLDPLKQIKRAKENTKLATFINTPFSVIINNFSYEYDILIDVGHGGVDVGASNDAITEADFNLIQSLYEKERYEQHGLTVLLSREDDGDGMMMGEFDSWNRAKLRGYAVGYYGVTAKIVYSNHNNSSENPSDSGFEIIVPNSFNRSELNTEFKIMNSLYEIYPKELINHIYTMYSRDIETGIAYNKERGSVYSYEDYYATTRLPLLLFKVDVTTYEGAYFNNEDNFYWYYYEEGWKKVSEAKIKAYVEALGKTYIPVD